jgi:hypothetical protein
MNRNRIAGVMRIHLRDKWGWILLPWIIIFSSFFINLIIAYTTQDEITTGGLSSIYIYMMIIGALGVHQSFPFAIGFSVRRKDYFLGTTATIGVLSAINGVLLWLLAAIESQSNGWRVGLHFFELPYLSEGSVIGQIWINFSMMICLFFLGFVIACLYRKFGRAGLNIFFISLLLLITIGGYLMTSYDLWKDLFDWFGDISAVELASGAFLITLINLLLSYLLLRRATV